MFNRLIGLLLREELCKLCELNLCLLEIIVELKFDWEVCEFLFYLVFLCNIDLCDRYYVYGWYLLYIING